jgi:hypothetical protein
VSYEEFELVLENLLQDTHTDGQELMPTLSVATVAGALREVESQLEGEGSAQERAAAATAAEAKLEAEVNGTAWQDAVAQRKAAEEEKAAKIAAFAAGQ